MARIRQIKPEFYLDDELARCPRDARLMFPGLWCLADRAGRLEDRPARIKAQLFPYDEDIRVDAVEGFLTILADRDFIQRYEVAGKRYIQIRTFIKHQHIHVKESPSQLPPPQLEGDTRTETVQEPGEHRSSTHTSTSTSGYMDNGFLGSGSGVSSSGSDSLSGSRPDGRSQTTGQKTAPPPPPSISFVLTKELRSWAEKTMPEIDTEAETEKFLDYYSRDGTTFASWPAAWRKWMRDAVEREKSARARESTEEHNERLRRKSQSL